MPTPPVGLKTCTVFGHYTSPDGSTPATGEITFELPAVLQLPDFDMASAGREPVPLVDGAFSVTLIATDNAGQPTEWRYKVTERLTGVTPRTYWIDLPSTTSPVNLFSIAPADPARGNYVLVPGPQGAPGPKGDPGTTGSPGASGTDGKSAYQLAVDSGFVGTEAEWLLSLVGPKGDPGTSAVLPWRFDITAYGAVADAVVVHDGSVTLGVPTLTCTTSAPFRLADVGKPVLIQGAGTFGVTAFKAVLSGYTSASSMSLSVSPPTSITNAIVVFGTNNYTAIRSATAAAEAYLAAGHPLADVYSPPTGSYVLDGPLDTSKSGNGLVPFGVYDTTANKPTLTFSTDGSGATVRHWEQQVPQVPGGAWISFGFYSSTSAQLTDLNANGNPGIISGPNEGTSNGLPYGAVARYSNIQPILKNMAFLVPHTAFGLTYGAFNFYGVANAHVENVSISTLGTVPSSSDYTTPGVFGTGLSVGCLMPAPGNNDLSIVRNLSIQGGFTYGIFFSEHTLIDRIMVLYCWAALCPVGTYAGSVGAVHAIKVISASVEACTNEVYIIGAGSQGVGPRIDIDQLSTESGTPTFSGNSDAARKAALGKIMLTGLYNRAGVTLGGPMGIELIDGQASQAITRKTGAFTAGPLDRTLVCDTSAAGFTATLPAADFNPVEYSFRNIGTNVLTLSASSGQLLFTNSPTGSATAAIGVGTTARVQALYNSTTSTWGWYVL